MSEMLPYLYDEEYSVIILGTMPSPGVMVASGHDRFKSWTIKAPNGTSGASTVLNGDKPAEFMCTFQIASDEFTEGLTELDKWAAFRRIVDSMTSGPKPIALPIYHPDLAEQGITEVTSGGIGGAVPDGMGGKLYTVKFLEYRPLKPKPVAKAAAVPGVRQGTTAIVKPDPNAAAKGRLAALAVKASQV